MSEKIDHISHQEEQMLEYTDPWLDDSYQGWLCAVSEANPHGKRKVQEDAAQLSSDVANPSKVKGKGNGKTCYSCSGRGHVAR